MDGLFGICYSECEIFVCIEFHTPFLFPVTKSVKVLLEQVGVCVFADGSVKNAVVSKKTHGGGDLVCNVININKEK